MFTDTHRIAGIHFRTEADFRISSFGHKRFQEFAFGNERFDIYHRVRSVDPDSLVLPPLGIQEKERILRYTCGSRKSIESPILKSQEVRYHVQACLEQPEQLSILVSPYSLVICDFRRHMIKGFYPLEFMDTLFDFRMKTSLPLIYNCFLSSFSSVMFHCSGLILGNSVPLFLAPDDGGKTTVLKTYPESKRQFLCDDRIVVRKNEKGFVAYGTPWGLFFNGSLHGNVGGLFLLEKAQNFELLPIKPKDILKFIWEEHFKGFSFFPKDIKKQAFETISDICCTIPGYRMRFSKNYVNWDAISAAMRGNVV